MAPRGEDVERRGRLDLAQPFRSALRRGLQEPDEEPEDEEEAAEYPRESQVILDLLRRDRSIIVSETITPRLTRGFIAQMLWLNSQSQDPIKIYINTPGGSADDGFALFDMIRFVTAPVTTICIGLSASAGTLVLLGASKERRFALPNARIMIHQPSGGAKGRAMDVEISAEEILKLRDRANRLIAEETGRDVRQVEKDTDKDYWLTAEEARKYGLVSRIVRSVREIA
ncbi:MAG: ATP-dependent Clp protease proteolytic subunit [Planctomycetota bacterium]